jgi:hypothetical protein
MAGGIALAGIFIGFGLVVVGLGLMSIGDGLKKDKK